MRPGVVLFASGQRGAHSMNMLMLEADRTLPRCGTDLIQEDPLQNCERLRRTLQLASATAAHL
jgi:hypothetical protein